jgi:hypothetical protein
MPHTLKDELTRTCARITPHSPPLATGMQAPREQLRVRLRDESAALGGGPEGGADGAGDDQYDLFSLSRSLGSDAAGDSAAAGSGAAMPGSAAAGLPGEERRALGPDEARTLSKLVGCIMKEGKRSRAQRILGDAMHIINSQLRKGSSTGPASAAGGKGA